MGINLTLINGEKHFIISKKYMCMYILYVCMSVLYINCFLLTCRHLTQFEELELLKEFEKRETNFTSKYRTKKKERGDLEVKVN